MKILTRFIVKQLLLSLLQIAIFTFLTLAVFASYLQISHENKTAIVQQLVTAHVSNDPKLLAKQLHNTLSFASLNIRQLDGPVLYTHMAATPPQAFSHNLYQWHGTLPIQAVTNHHPLNIQLNFSFSLEQELAMLDKMLLMLLSTLVVLNLLNVLLVREGVRNIFARVAQTLASDIRSFSKLEKAEQFEWQPLPTEFDPVKLAVKETASAVSQQLSLLKTSAEAIKDEALKDELTGLPNRNRFVRYFEEQLQDSNSKARGSLAVVRCSQLQEINHTRGYQEGDKYVLGVVQIIEQSAEAYKGSQCYRLNGADFAVLLPNVAMKNAEAFAQSLQVAFNQYQHSVELDSVAYTGLVSWAPGKPLGELLALTDTAISIAQTRQSNAWHAHKEGDSSNTNNSAAYGNQSWRQVIEDVLSNNRVMLLKQTILPTNNNSRAYAEVLARFKTAENQILPTASFLAMAEKLDKIAQVDRMIIEATLSHIKDAKLTDQYFGLNITPKSVQDEQFMTYLERRLLQDPKIGAQLVFEVSEFGLQQNIQASKRFIEILHKAGARITVERFGVGLTSFKFFRDLKPDFIKMDGTYTRNIHEDRNNQYFLRLMVDLAHRIGVKVFTEGVETSEEKHALEQLFIDGTQGYFIGKPTPF